MAGWGVLRLRTCRIRHLNLFPSETTANPISRIQLLISRSGCLILRIVYLGATMRRVGTIVLIPVFSILAASPVWPQSIRVRGTIERLDGTILTIKSRDGEDLSVELSDDAVILATVKSSLSVIKPGSFVGVAGTPQPDGSERALEINIFPETMRGTGEGRAPWDLRPNSTMTNATVVQTVAGVDDHTLTLKYKDGERKVIITPDTTVVALKPGAINDLKVGAEIVIVGAERLPNGTLRATRVIFASQSPPTDAIDASTNSLEGLLGKAIAIARSGNGDTCEVVDTEIICRKGTGNASSSRNLASTLSQRLRDMPAKYNKPGVLLLGNSEPVEFVIQTSEQQQVDDMFKGFKGDVTATTVRVADNVSAVLTGPRDMVEITLRGEPLRTILRGTPVSWVWDVRPLKPGQAQVVLEVFSHVKVAAEEQRAQIRVLQDTWTMEARGFEWVKYQISEIEPVRGFVFAMVSAAAATLAYFGVRGRWSNKPDTHET
jgi:Domain of unknown function (DUF5666)